MDYRSHGESGQGAGAAREADSGHDVKYAACTFRRVGGEHDPEFAYKGRARSSPPSRRQANQEQTDVLAQMQDISQNVLSPSRNPAAKPRVIAASPPGGQGARPKVPSEAIFWAFSLHFPSQNGATGHEGGGGAALSGAPWGGAALPANGRAREPRQRQWPPIALFIVGGRAITVLCGPVRAGGNVEGASLY